MKEEMPNSKEFAAYDYLQSAATQDCTGLIPMAPANEEERDSYEDLYPVLPLVASNLTGSDTDNNTFNQF